MSNTPSISSLTRAVALACALGGLIGAAHADTVVKLGFAAPLTGPQAHYGEEYKNGVTRMALT